MRDRPQTKSFTLLTMRKIETQMNRAIRTQSNWAGANTSVFTADDGLLSKVFLHGNHIATYFHAERELQIFDGGYQSNTTKSRLNALCDEFAYGCGVFQKQWVWYVSNRLTNSIKEFYAGYTLAAG